MESRFSKYKESTMPTAPQNQVTTINNFIDALYTKGLDIIEAEVKDLQRRIDSGDAPKMFLQKKPELIKLGETIERLYNLYHFNKN